MGLLGVILHSLLVAALLIIGAVGLSFIGGSLIGHLIHEAQREVEDHIGRNYPAPQRERPDVHELLL